jgi:phosphohistidine phosphatase
MKSLFLLRHAKSSWAEPGASDFDRPLNARGREAAQAIGREMRRLGLGVDAVVMSSAARAVETLRLLAKGYGETLDAREEERAYLAPVATLLQIIAGADDVADRLLLVGHNPGLDLLAAALTEGDDSPERAAMVGKYPTGALAEIAFEVGHWRDVAPGGGRLVRFIRPRDLES